MRTMLYRFALAAALTGGALLPAQARITDAAGDFVSTYTGVKGGDLDV